jgi:hypothetical protein
MTGSLTARTVGLRADTVPGDGSATARYGRWPGRPAPLCGAGLRNRGRWAADDVETRLNLLVCVVAQEARCVEPSDVRA